MKFKVGDIVQYKHPDHIQNLIEIIEVKDSMMRHGVTEYIGITIDTTAHRAKGRRVIIESDERVLPELVKGRLIA